MKDSTVTIRIDSNLKRQAEEILKKIGLTNSTAISLFYSTVILNKGLPFRLRLDSVPTMSEEEQNDTENILNKRKPSDKRIARTESVEIIL